VPTFDPVLRKFFLYGAAGWAVEVFFTGLASAIERDRSATAKTYLWMHPIYGGTALALEQLSKRLKPRAPWWARALAYTGVMYVAEYASGWTLRKALGRCPWDYSGCGRDVHGLVRLDYAPAWFGLALLVEPVQAVLETLEEAMAEKQAAAEPAPEPQASTVSSAVLPAPISPEQAAPLSRPQEGLTVPAQMAALT
jgi:uncharacterized membrane protein